MSRSHSTQRRFENLLRNLDDRIEEQSMLPGADAPAAVQLADRFHSWAGLLEYKYSRGAFPESVIGQGLRQLHRIQVQHAQAVRR